MDIKSTELTGELKIEHLRKTLASFRQNMYSLPPARRLAEKMKIQDVERQLRDCGAAAGC